MATLPIDLKWHLDSKGYRLVDHASYGSIIVANGGKIKHIRPLDGIDGLYKVFANVRSPGELLNFVRFHGLLHKQSYKAQWVEGVLEKKAREDSPLGRYSRQLARASVNAPKMESVSELLEIAALFRKIMVQSQKGWRRTPKPLGLEMSLRLDRRPLGWIGLRDDATRGFRPAFIANSLLDALWLQLAGNISGGAIYRKCARCENMFETGPKTGRRAGSKFCSDTHKIEFNSRKRSKNAVLNKAQ